MLFGRDLTTYSCCWILLLKLYWFADRPSMCGVNMRLWISTVASAWTSITHSESPAIFSCNHAQSHKFANSQDLDRTHKISGALWPSTHSIEICLGLPQLLEHKPRQRTPTAIGYGALNICTPRCETVLADTKSPKSQTLPRSHNFRCHVKYLALDSSGSARACVCLASAYSRSKQIGTTPS